jgi:hypothetical protein
MTLYSTLYSTETVQYVPEPYFLRPVLRIRIRDSGSGAFLPPGSGSGLWDGAMVGSGIRDKQTKFVNSLYTKKGRIRDPVLFYPPGFRIRDPDPGWSNGRIRIQDTCSGIKHPGSATLP